MINRPFCEVYWLGHQDYEAAWRLQSEMAADIATRKRPATLLLLEHPHTFTVGRRGGMEHVKWKQAEREERGISMYEVDRGGDVTYHGPGQLVGYPLLPLAPLGWQGSRLPQVDFVGYVRNLEKMLILALARYGIPAGQRKGLSGVWVMADVFGRCPRCDPRLRPEPGKIASIGVKIDARGISRHGFALNIQPDMTFWQGIVPCGIDGVQMICMGDLLDTPPVLEEMAGVMAESFAEVFNYEIQWVFPKRGEPVI
jgi:lipoyl(octanoyl) transferase